MLILGTFQWAVITSITLDGLVCGYYSHRHTHIHKSIITCILATSKILNSTQPMGIQECQSITVHVSFWLAYRGLFLIPVWAGIIWPSGVPTFSQTAPIHRSLHRLPVEVHVQFSTSHHKSVILVSKYEWIAHLTLLTITNVLILPYNIWLYFISNRPKGLDSEPFLWNSNESKFHRFCFSSANPVVGLWKDMVDWHGKMSWNRT